MSVIVPARDRPRQLADCLGALAAQDCPDDRYEVIVVDDGSEPPLGVPDALLAGRLRPRFIRQANAGPAAARNVGAAAARGRILAFTDDDCLPDPGWLPALRASLDANPGALVGGRTANLLPGDVFASASQLIIDLVYAHYNAESSRARFFASNNLALSAETFRALGGFDPTFVTSEDRDLCDRCLCTGRPMVYVPSAIVRHAHHLTLGSFWKQHLGYGRGAWRHREAHRRRTSSSTISPDFYLWLARRIPAALTEFPAGRAVAMAALLAVWQVANAAGFLAEALHPRIREADRAPR